MRPCFVSRWTFAFALWFAWEARLKKKRHRPRQDHDEGHAYICLYSFHVLQSLFTTSKSNMATPLVVPGSSLKCVASLKHRSVIPGPCKHVAARILVLASTWWAEFAAALTWPGDSCSFAPCRAGGLQQWKGECCTAIWVTHPPATPHLPSSDLGQALLARRKPRGENSQDLTDISLMY